MSSTVSTRTVVSQDPTGTWQHPRLEEINRRRNRTTFGQNHARSIAINIALLVLVFALPALMVPGLGSKTKSTATQDFTYYVLFAVKVVIATNLFVACLPLLRAKDDLADIPLTPRQRALLGLNPSTTPATPGSTYVTPPRYTPSSTPRSASSGRSSAFSGSSRGGSNAGTPYSPSASPLFQKTVSRDVTRRLSYGTPSPLSLSKTANESSSSLTAHTPSPTTGRGASVGLNSRWLYEKGRSGSQFRSLYS